MGEETAVKGKFQMTLGEDGELTKVALKTYQQNKLSLLDKFGVPPFSVLDARQGYWQDRKKEWIGLGIESGEGREDGLTWTPGASGKDSSDLDDTSKRIAGTQSSGTTSVFDPVLTELVIRWFSPKGGRILDPFAGGSVRGIVSETLDRRYVGIDLNDKQVEANRIQSSALGVNPQYIVGDSRNIGESIVKGDEFDFLFTCPPYYNLERYSDKPNDLSNAGSYYDFIESYYLIIDRACARLKDNRFAAILVGDIRSDSGYYYNFPLDTVAAFESAGLKLYNEAILVTMVGSTSLRAGRQFTQSRKLGKTHQNLYVFYKGDPKKATEACGIIEVGV